MPHFPVHISNFSRWLQPWADSLDWKYGNRDRHIDPQEIATLERLAYSHPYYARALPAARALKREYAALTRRVTHTHSNPASDFGRLVMELVQGRPPHTINPRNLAWYVRNDETAKLLVEANPSVYHVLPADFHTKSGMIQHYLDRCYDPNDLMTLTRGLSKNVIAADPKLYAKMVRTYIQFAFQSVRRQDDFREIEKRAFEHVTSILPPAREVVEDKDSLLEMLKEVSPRILKFAPSRWLKDPDFCVEAAAANPAALSEIKPEIIKKASFQKSLLKRNIMSYMHLKHMGVEIRKTALSDPDTISQLAYFEKDVWNMIAKQSQTKALVSKTIQNGASLKGVKPSIANDPKIKQTACSVSGFNFPDINATAEEIRDLALKALGAPNNKYGDTASLAAAVWEKLPDALKTDSNFLKQATLVNGAMLQYCPEETKKDLEFVREVVAHCGSAWQHAHETIQQNDEVLLAAIASKNWDVLDLLPKDIFYREGFVPKAIKANPSVWHILPEELRSKEKALETTRDTGYLCFPADQQASFDPDFMLKMISANVNAIQTCAPRLLASPQFMTKVARAFPPVLDMPLKTAVPKELIFYMYPDVKRAYEDLKPQYEELDITKPWLLKDLTTLKEIIKNRNEPDPQDKPLAIVIFPKEDHNGAFMWNNLENINDGYHVKYYEADSEQDFIDAIQESTEARKADFVYIGGHGSRDVTSFGAEDPAMEKTLWDYAVLDLGDESQMVQEKLGDCVKDGAPVVMKSCSVAKGRGHAQNIVNMVSRIFPGTDCYGPVISTNNWIKLDDNGLFVDPGYAGGPWITHKTRYEG